MKNWKLHVVILYLVTLLFWFSQSSYVAYITPTLKVMGVSATIIGFIGGIYGFVQLVLRVPLGVSADKFNLQKAFICIGAFLAMLSSLGMFLFYSPMGFLFFRGLAGAASATWVCFTVTFSSYFESEKAPNAMSALSSANYSGKLIGLMLVGLAASVFGTRYAFLVAFIAGIFCFVLSFFVKAPPTNERNLKASELLDVLKNKHLIMVAILALLAQFIAYSATYSFSPIVARNIGANDFNLATANLITTVFLIISSILSSKYLIKVFGTKKLLILGLLFFGIYCFQMAFVSDLNVLYVLQAFAGLGEGLTIPILTGLCMKGILPEKKSTAMGIYSAIYGLGMTLGPICMGSLVDIYSIVVAFVFTGVVALLTIIFVFFKLN